MEEFFRFRLRLRGSRDAVVGLLVVLLLAFSVLASGCSSGAPDVSGTWEFRDSEGGGILFMPNEDGPATEGVVAVFDRDLGLPVGGGVAYYVLEGDTISMGNDLVWKIEVSGDAMTATDVSNGKSGDSYKLERTKAYP
jgi:hypothetical protein